MVVHIIKKPLVIAAEEGCRVQFLSVFCRSFEKKILVIIP